MTDALWQWDELVAASAGRADGAPAAAITGFSIDTRSLAPGEVFVALKDQRDGHEFVANAFKAGAAAALVCEPYERKPADGALIRVPDVLTALESIARAARARLAPEARVIAVTGSAGKTSTKDMLRACLGRLGPTHASDKSFNNHWGVPLTLARMPRHARYAVFEIGMNHPGEITPLVHMVRPHVAIVTTVEAVHLEHFGSVEEIADAKAEILSGIEPGGTAILNRDNPHFERLRAAAAQRDCKVVCFGEHSAADARLVGVDHGHFAGGTIVIATVGGQHLDYHLGAIGHHFALNSLAVVAALQAVGAPLWPAIAALADTHAPKGRGDRTLLSVLDGALLLIDESYNANPASMRAALAAMATTPRERWHRRIAVLGDMLELGPESGDLHRGLKEAIDAAGVDLVFAAGSQTRLLFERLPVTMQGGWGPTSIALRDALLAAVRAGDVLMIKGSNGSAMGLLVEALKQRFPVAG
jgi:UDP-N-acetylmuramoyl-tripeptide--D-alanyl-D-alanine ligase